MSKTKLKSILQKRNNDMLNKECRDLRLNEIFDIIDEATQWVIMKSGKA